MNILSSQSLNCPYLKLLKHNNLFIVYIYIVVLFIIYLFFVFFKLKILNEENDKTHNIDRLKIYINVINTLRNIIDRIHLLNNTVVNKIVDYGKIKI